MKNLMANNMINKIRSKKNKKSCSRISRKTTYFLIQMKIKLDIKMKNKFLNVI